MLGQGPARQHPGDHPAAHLASPFTPWFAAPRLACGFVTQQDVARVEGPGLDVFEPQRRLDAFEMRFTLTEDHRVHNNAEFIEKARWHKGGRQVGTAKYGDVFTWLFLEVPNFFFDVLRHQP